MLTFDCFEQVRGTRDIQFYVIFKKLVHASCFIGVSNTRKLMKARGRRPSAFIVFECLKPRWNTKHELLKLHLQQKKISLNYHLIKFSQFNYYIWDVKYAWTSKKMCMMCMVLSPNCCAVTIFEYSTTEVTLLSCLSVLSILGSERTRCFAIKQKVEYRFRPPKSVWAPLFWGNVCI